MSSTGIVYLVGAGPWDAGLLTLRGQQVLGWADLVVYDYLVNPEHLVHAPQAEHHSVGQGADRMSQAEINALLVQAGQAGRVVVRLKGGDPFVFGRGGEEAAALVEGQVPFEVVPGVTAAVASAAYAGIPVTHRGVGATLTLCTGHRRADGPNQDIDWPALAKMHTVVFYMGRRNLGSIAEQLIAHGRSPQTPVALIEWATRPAQRTRVTTLAQAADTAEAAQMKPPITVVVGEVVSLSAQIGWFERKPLHGQTVVVTRSKGQQGVLASRLRELGAEVLVMPTIAFEPCDPAPVAAAVARLDTYDWVVFTSANAVDFFMQAVERAGLDSRAFGKSRLACVGSQSARRLAAYGLRADLVPDTGFVAEGLIEAFGSERLAGAKVLLPRAEVARQVLPETLEAQGASVEVLAVYRTYRPEPDAGMVARVLAEADWVTFTSSSTAAHFAAAFDTDERAELQGRIRVASMGPVTSKAARGLGFQVEVEASVYTVAGLVEALSSC